jgi:hypothetical protein
MEPRQFVEKYERDVKSQKETMRKVATILESQHNTIKRLRRQVKKSEMRSRFAMKRRRTEGVNEAVEMHVDQGMSVEDAIKNAKLSPEEEKQFRAMVAEVEADMADDVKEDMPAEAQPTGDGSPQVPPMMEPKKKEEVPPMPGNEQKEKPAQGKSEEMPAEAQPAGDGSPQVPPTMEPKKKEMGEEDEDVDDDDEEDKKKSKGAMPEKPKTENRVAMPSGDFAETNKSVNFREMLKEHFAN